MTDTIQILQPIVIDSLSSGTIPLNVSLVDSTANIVLQFSDNIPVSFVDNTAHNWFMENLLGIIAFFTTILSIGFNIYQYKSAKEEKEQSQEHEIKLKAIETEEHRKEAIYKDGLKKEYDLYQLLLVIDELSFQEKARVQGTEERKNFIEKINEANLYISKNKLYISDKLIYISRHLTDIYKRLGVEVNGEVLKGVLNLIEMYEDVFKNKDSQSQEQIEQLCIPISNQL